MSKRVEKIDLNNQIVSMRKDVKRSRLWLINNLNNKIKSLKKKKGSEKEVAKNLERINKFHNEMKLLKTLAIDEISKFALCNQQEKLDDKYLATLEPQQQALLRIASHKFVQLHVTKFCETHSVTTDKLILLVRSLGLQYQKKKEQPDTRNLSEDPNSDDLEEAEQESTNLRLPQSMDDSVFKQPKQDTIELTQSASKQSSNKKKVKSKTVASTNSSSNNKSKQVENTSLHGSESEIMNKSPHRKPLRKIAWPEPKAPVIDKRVGTMEIKHLTNLEISESSIPVAKRQQSLNNVTHLPLDSFFVGGVDPPEKMTETKEKVRKFEKVGFSRSVPKEKIRKNSRNVKKEARAVGKFANKEPLGVIRPFGLKKAEKFATHDDASDKGLHPSWQAKKREKELHINIDQPQGKKIKFDD